MFNCFNLSDNLKHMECLYYYVINYKQESIEYD